MIERLRGVCLERTVEVGVSLHLRDWPGVAGPLVHVPDPFVASPLIDTIAASLAPRYRVLSLASRGDCPFTVDALDLRDTLRQFGFVSPILIGEGLGCLTTLVAAAWYVSAGVVLVDQRYDPPVDNSVASRTLRDCAPNIAQLRQALTCEVIEVQGDSVIAEVERFAATLP